MKTNIVFSLTNLGVWTKEKFAALAKLDMEVEAAVADQEGHLGAKGD